VNKYGQIPPRNLESFGVAGLLGENCHVFYSVLFSTRHVGKTSDLLAAKLREAGVEDFQLRMAVLVKIFEVAYSVQGEWKTPINVECGVDDEKVAIGVSFTLPPEIEIDPATFVAKIGDSQNVLARLSLFLREACDRLIIKFEPKSRRYETCVLIPLSGVLNLEERAIPAPPTFLTLTEAQAGIQPPKAGVYTELGDVEYGKLLQDDKAKKEGKPIPPSAGERLAAAAKEEEIKTKIQREAEVTAEETQKVKGKAEKAEKSEQKLSGKAEQDNSKTKLKGSKEEEDKTEKKLSGDKTNEESKTKVEGGEQGPGIVEKIMDALGLGQKEQPQKTKVSGKKESEDEAATVFKGDSEELLKSKERIKALEEKIAKLQNEALNRKDAKPDGPHKQVFKADQKEKVIEETVVIENGKKLRKKKVVKTPEPEPGADLSPAESSESKPGEEGPGILEKIMDALGIGGKKEEKKTKKAKAEEEVIEIVEEITDDGEAIPVEAKAEKEEKKPAVSEEEVEILKEAAKEAESIVKQSESLDEAIKRAKAESGNLKEELKSPKAKKFVDGFMQEVIQEKAKIQEMAKKMNLSIRQKEFEFKNKERMLQEEVRKRDEELRAKTTAIMRSKERMAQMQASMDQAKTANNKTDEAYKQKYTNAQKLLSQTQEQNSALTSNIADLKVQISQLKQRAPGNNSQFTELKTKFDRSQKQIDEYKKMNQQLLDKLNEAGSKKGGASSSLAVEEMKKKMENAIKLAQEQKSETETLKIKVEELEAESLRLKRELEVASQKPAA